MSATAAPAVVVVGSVNVDLVFRVGRLPDRGETVIGGTFGTGLGGKGANQAAAAARLGARSWLVGVIGDDQFGVDARRGLEDVGVNLRFLRTAATPTGVAAVLVDDEGDNMIAVASGANTELDPDHVAASVNAVAAAAGPRAVVLANLEVPDDAVLAAARAATAAGLPFVLNPAPARTVSDELLHHCAVVTPNDVEAAVLGGGSLDSLLSRGARAVVVTRGADGCELLRSGRSPVRQPAFDVDVVDTTGAGDAFSAAVAWAMASGAPLEEAIRVGAGAGALATRGLGARSTLPDQIELEALLQRRR